MLVISSSKNVKQGCKLKLTYLYVCSIMSIRHHLQYENGTPKVAGNAFNIGEVWNPVCCHGNKTANCAAHLVESYCKESNISDTICLRYLFSWYFIKIWLSVWCHHLANLHIIKNLNISGTKRYLKIVNGILLLVQASCLCFKMASIQKMRFLS